MCTYLWDTTLAHRAIPVTVRSTRGLFSCADQPGPTSVSAHTMRRRILIAASVALGLATSAMSHAQGTNDIEQGRRLFETHCAPCHGPGGEGGKGPTLAQPSLPRASDDDSLRRIIREGIGGTEMPSARLHDDDIRLVAAFVKSLGARPRDAVPGDAARGSILFNNKGGCLQCHTLHGHGGAFGPDLSDVGLRRSPSYLRRALVDPGADVPLSFTAFRWDVSLPQNFLYVRAVTRGGTEVDGVRINEDTFSIQIRDVSGAIHSFYKAELAELHKDFGKSPMPSFASTMTAGQIDDLTAFLSSLRSSK
jgi:cytochrome c oxidase cbb3-type subunit 3